jgi:hypothetical protein
VWRATGSCIGPLLGSGRPRPPAELGDRPLLELVVDDKVNLLVVEGDQPGDHDPHLARGGQDVDPGVGVAGWV